MKKIIQTKKAIPSYENNKEIVLECVESNRYNEKIVTDVKKCYAAYKNTLFIYPDYRKFENAIKYDYEQFESFKDKCENLTDNVS